MFIAWLAAGIAFAADPSFEVSSDGAVVARVHIPASEGEVRRLLADPVASQQLTPEVRSVSATSQGTCSVVAVETDGIWNPMHYTARRCPTADGFQTDLVHSEDFSDLHVEWKLKSSGAGTDVVYSVRTNVASIPAALARKGTERSMRQTLVALLAKLVRP
jgi:hypothetical protein